MGERFSVSVEVTPTATSKIWTILLDGKTGAVSAGGGGRGRERCSHRRLKRRWPNSGRDHQEYAVFSNHFIHKFRA